MLVIAILCLFQITFSLQRHHLSDVHGLSLDKEQFLDLSNNRNVHKSQKRAASVALNNCYNDPEGARAMFDGAYDDMVAAVRTTQARTNDILTVLGDICCKHHPEPIQWSVNETIISSGADTI